MSHHPISTGCLPETHRERIQACTANSKRLVARRCTRTGALGRERALHAASLGGLTCICILQSAWHRLPAPLALSRWVGRSHACCAVLRCSLCRSSVLALHHWNCVPAGPAKPAAAASLSLTHTRNKYVRARVRYYSIGVTPSRIIHAHACGYTTPRFQISMEADRRIEGCWRRPIAATDKTSWQRALISFFPFFVFLF